MQLKNVKINDAELSLFILSNSSQMNLNRKRPLIVICPGGGYEYLSDREADPIAVRFLSYDFNVAVLRYTINCEGDGNRPIFPKPQKELADSIAYIRAHADELNTNPNMIAVMGFSAGGHIAASIGCHWDKFNKNARPDALLLCYALLLDHPICRSNLVGEDKSHEEFFNLDKQVTDNTPTSFIWATKTDNVVPYENSMKFKQALDAHHIPNEIHIFEEGCHGLSLATREVKGIHERNYINPDVAIWPDLARAWLLKTFGDQWY